MLSEEMYFTLFLNSLKDGKWIRDNVTTDMLTNYLVSGEWVFYEQIRNKDNVHIFDEYKLKRNKDVRFISVPMNPMMIDYPNRVCDTINQLSEIYKIDKLVIWTKILGITKLHC